jgi:SAM-dependent methyltransferase
LNCFPERYRVNSNLKRYDLFGWDYEQRNPLTHEEISWYLNFAGKTGGPVLELACGTGRLLSVIAENGFDIDGIDLSPTMLELAAQRVAGLSSEVASRIHLYNQDITSFSLERRFGLVFIADGSFGVLTTKEQQRMCLQNVCRHLRSDGVFLITVRRFDPSRFLGGKQIIDWSEPVRHPVDGSLVARRWEIDLVDTGTRLQGFFYYRVSRADGSEAIEECYFESPVMSESDYISLFSETVFQPEAYVNYRERMDDGKHPVLCFVCAKTGNED